jgi:hypothetical protein
LVKVSSDITWLIYGVIEYAFFVDAHGMLDNLLGGRFIKPA